MDFEIFIVAATVSVNSFLGFYVLSANPEGKANRLFFLSSISAIAWSSFFALELTTGEPLVWAPPGLISLSLIFVFFIHFTVEFPRAKPVVHRETLPKPFRWFPSALLNWDQPILSRPAAKVAFIYAPFMVTGILMALRPSEFGYTVVLSPLGHRSLAVTHWTVGALVRGGIDTFYIIYTLITIIYQYLLSRRDEKRQMAVVFLGTLFFIALSALDYVAALPMGAFPLVPALLAFAYAIGRHHLLVSPAAETPSQAGSRFDLEKGICYMVRENKPSLSFEVFADAVTHGAHGLCLTRMPPEKIRQQYGLQRTPIVWVGEQPLSQDIRSVDSADKIAYVCDKFLRESSDGIVIFDCLEYLIQTTDFRRVMRLLYRLKEMVTRNNARLIISVSPDSLQKQELSLLEKEFEQLTKL